MPLLRRHLNLYLIQGYWNRMQFDNQVMKTRRISVRTILLLTHLQPITSYWSDYAGCFKIAPHRSVRTSIIFKFLNRGDARHSGSFKFSVFNSLTWDRKTGVPVNSLFYIKSQRLYHIYVQRESPLVNVAMNVKKNSGCDIVIRIILLNKVSVLIIWKGKKLWLRIIYYINLNKENS